MRVIRRKGHDAPTTVHKGPSEILIPLDTGISAQIYLFSPPKPSCMWGVEGDSVLRAHRWDGRWRTAHFSRARFVALCQDYGSVGTWDGNLGGHGFSEPPKPDRNFVAAIKHGQLTWLHNIMTMFSETDARFCFARTCPRVGDASSIHRRAAKPCTYLLEGEGQPQPQTLEHGEL